MVNKKTDDMNETNKTTKKTVRRKTTKKKEAAAKPALSEKERQALALQHIQQLLQTGQKKGSLTYTEIMNLMEEDDLTPDQIDKMYELFADKGIDIIGEEDSMRDRDEIDDEDTEKVIKTKQLKTIHHKGIPGSNIAFAFHTELRCCNASCLNIPYYPPEFHYW